MASKFMYYIATLINDIVTKFVEIPGFTESPDFFLLTKGSSPIPAMPLLVSNSFSEYDTPSFLRSFFRYSTVFVCAHSF